MKLRKLIFDIPMKFVYLLIFIIITSPFVNAQIKTDPNQKCKFFSSVGIFVGADLSYLTGDAPKDASYAGKPGFLGGLSAEFNLTKDIKLLLQPTYNLKNTKVLYDVGEEDPRDSLLLKFSYFRVPVLMKINAFNGVTYFLSGLDFGFLLSSKLSKTVNPSEETDISNLVNKFDLSVIFGFGVKFKLWSNSLFAELRYSQGLLNMSDNSVTKFDSYLPARFRVMGLQLLAGYNFNL
jgi:hypothetical protein